MRIRLDDLSGPQVRALLEEHLRGMPELSPTHGEIKSMRTALAHRRQGVARAMLVHIVDEARRRAYDRLSLETGSMAAFLPAQRLYASFGLTRCGPFADYVEDPNSVFMTRELSEDAR